MKHEYIATLSREINTQLQFMQEHKAFSLSEVLNVYRYNSLLKKKKKKAQNFSVTEVTLICVKKKYIYYNW